MQLDLPESVIEFLRSVANLRDPALRINPLSPEEAALETERLRQIPIVERLGLIVLDDANDSNPHCLVTTGPASGMVAHFSHDPEPSLAFASPSAFREALGSAHDHSKSIDELERCEISPAQDQTSLQTELNDLLAAAHDEEAVMLLSLFLQLLDPTDAETVGRAASHVDFLVRECASLFVDAHPDPNLRDVALALSKDEYPQVSAPARRALRSMNTSNQDAG